MSYDEALKDLRDSYGKKKLLTAQEVAEHIGKTPEAFAVMRHRKQFPAARKVGSRVVVSIYDLAKYIAGEYQPPQEESPPPPTRSRQAKPPAKAASSKATRSPPTIDPIALRRFREGLQFQSLQLEFQSSLFAALERISLERSLND